jgi:hypothetical protein
LRLGLSSVAMVVAAVCGFLVLPEGHGPTPAHADTNAVTFPPLDQLKHYTTVRRGVTREHMLTSRAALDAIQALTSGGRCTATSAGVFRVFG